MPSQPPGGDDDGDNLRPGGDWFTTHTDLRLSAFVTRLCTPEESRSDDARAALRDEWFKVARYEGRHMENLYKDDYFDMIGWNMYMPPEQAAEGLELFKNVEDFNDDLESSGVHKDLSLYPIYEKANR